MKRSGSWLNRLMHGSIDLFQDVVGSPLFFTLFWVVTLAWMSLQWLLSATHHTPLDSPKDDFPTTVLVYTLVGLWIENAMKVAQKQQLRLQSEQLDRLEAMSRDEVQRDRLLNKTVHALELAVQRLYELEQAAHRKPSSPT